MFDDIKAFYRVIGHLNKPNVLDTAGLFTLYLLEKGGLVVSPRSCIPIKEKFNFQPSLSEFDAYNIGSACFILNLESYRKLTVISPLADPDGVAETEVKVKECAQGLKLVIGQSSRWQSEFVLSEAAVEILRKALTSVPDFNSESALGKELGKIREFIQLCALNHYRALLTEFRQPKQAVTDAGPINFQGGKENPNRSLNPLDDEPFIHGPSPSLLEGGPFFPGMKNVQRHDDLEAFQPQLLHPKIHDDLGELDQPLERINPQPTGSRSSMLGLTDPYFGPTADALRKRLDESNFE